MPKGNTLQDELNRIIMTYIHEFEQKHELQFDGFVGDDIIGVAWFGDVLFFNVSDIVQDVDNNYPKGLIVEWAYSTMERRNMKQINLRSYAMGFRY